MCVCLGVVCKLVVFNRHSGSGVFMYGRIRTVTRIIVPWIWRRKATQRRAVENNGGKGKSVCALGAGGVTRACGAALRHLLGHCCVYRQTLLYVYKGVCRKPKSKCSWSSDSSPAQAERVADGHYKLN